MIGRRERGKQQIRDALILTAHERFLSRGLRAAQSGGKRRHPVDRAATVGGVAARRGQRVGERRRVDRRGPVRRTTPARTVVARDDTLAGSSAAMARRPVGEEGSDVGGGRADPGRSRDHPHPRFLVAIVFGVSRAAIGQWGQSGDTTVAGARRRIGEYVDQPQLIFTSYGLNTELSQGRAEEPTRTTNTTSDLTGK